MKNTEIYTLIDDEFTSDEAKEILLKMISFKINFYNIKNWSSHERFGCDDDVAQKRLSALKKESEILQSVFTDAKIKDMKLSVKSEINISLVED
jgi:hypothetical protein